MFATSCLRASVARGQRYLRPGRKCCRCGLATTTPTVTPPSLPSLLYSRAGSFTAAAAAAASTAVQGRVQLQLPGCLQLLLRPPAGRLQLLLRPPAGQPGRRALRAGGRGEQRLRAGVCPTRPATHPSGLMLARRQLKCWLIWEPTTCSGLYSWVQCDH